MIGLAIGYIGLVFAYLYQIGTMCKQATDTDIHKHLFMGTRAPAILAMPVYVTVD